MATAPVADKATTHIHQDVVSKAARKLASNPDTSDEFIIVVDRTAQSVVAAILKKLFMIDRNGNGKHILKKNE